MLAVDASDANMSHLGRISGRTTLLPSGLNVASGGSECLDGLAQNAQMRRQPVLVFVRGQNACRGLD
jgi:hypothetical protein